MSLLHRLLTHLDRLFIGTLSIDDQYRTPRGLTGFLTGQVMLQQHQPENLWTLELLDLHRGAQVLEIGHGPGLLLSKIARRVPGGQVHGLELSHSMVHLARLRNLPQVVQGKVRIRQGNALQLPYPDRHMNTVVSIHSLYFWPSPLQVLQECHRVLKPGGQLVLTFMPRDRWPGLGEGATCHVFSENDVVALMQQAGFQQVKVVPGQAHFRECAVVGRA